jgi:Na+-driven multidrug efflux pump
MDTPSTFQPALVPLLVLLPGMWFMGTGSLVVGDLRGRGRPGLASAVKGGAALVTVGLDLALIPAFGVIGAAVASSLAYAAFGIGSLVVLSRIAGVPVRRLTVPTRDDLGLYRRAGGALLKRLRRELPEGDGGRAVGAAEPLVVGD